MTSLTPRFFGIDPAHLSFRWWEDPFSQEVWEEKYRYREEADIFTSMGRVAAAIMGGEKETIQVQTLESMQLGLWMPAGRIMTSAGTDNIATMLNCFVNEPVEDSMAGISRAFTNTLLTLQQGGGMGTDFSTLRPQRAILGRYGNGAAASGPIPFMKMWDSGSSTIRTVGGRNGAMMGTLCDTHPDLLKFVRVKQTKGVMEGFNVSILVSDAFMQAIEDDEEWALYFHVPPADNKVAPSFVDDHGVTQYIYSTHSARELWAEITKATYEYSEPGVLFIDRINDLNNLQYCEEIRCTNPCVTGDTLVLTNEGHLPIKWLAGKVVNVWNGEQYSSVKPFSTGLNDLYEVSFTNGQKVRCTPTHKWVLSDESEVETRYLQEGTKLLYTELPTIVDGAAFLTDAYSQGFYSGDGTRNAKSSNLYKHNEGIRNRLVGKIYDRNCVDQPGHRWVHGDMLPKDFVPVTGSLYYCVNWLAGLLDADGCVSRKQSTKVLEISAKDRGFLQRVGLMLNRLGVNYRIWERSDAGLKNGSNGIAYQCESTAALMISYKGAHHLVTLGLKCERIDLSSFQTAPKGIARVGHRVLSVRKLIQKEETFCLNEPLRNTFIANGVITHNCGEQPLSPDDACDLGHYNVARMVRYPFSPRARFDFDLLEQIVPLGQRFLDNVIDYTIYPLPQQKEKHYSTRRTGAGFTGLASVFAQLGMKYGSIESVRMAERITQTIAIGSYRTSVELARERGAFPAFDPEAYFEGFAGRMLPRDLQEDIKKYGIRNGVLNTVAPTGTMSAAYGDVESGCEPAFSISYMRRRRDANNEWKEYPRETFSYRFYKHCKADPSITPEELPEYFVTAQDLTVNEHIAVQAAVQKWIDASVSKTINLPKDTAYEDFVQVYTLAYHSGCKGCTTYRPSDVRGSILSVQGGDGSGGGTSPDTLPPGRPDVLTGHTYKIKWPSLSAAMYITINTDERGHPYEIFFASKDARYAEWMAALTLMISAIFRQTDDPMFVAQELKQVVSAHDQCWVGGKHYNSLVAYIGTIIETHLTTIQGNKETLVIPQPRAGEEKSEIPDYGASLTVGTERVAEQQLDRTQRQLDRTQLDMCPACGQRSLAMEEGCARCHNCSYSKC